jgi:hypothetical protein
VPSALEGRFARACALVRFAGAGGGALAHGEVEAEVLHRRVEVFLDGRLEPVNLVDEQDVSALQIGEKSCQVTGLLDHGAARGFDFRADGVADDVCERRFAQAGRAAQEDVLQDVAALECCLHHELQPIQSAALSGKLLK